MKKITFSAISCMAIAACLGAQTNFYVSPAAGRGGDGSKLKPFANFSDAAKAVLNAPKGDYIINLAPGDYQIDKSIVFLKKDMDGKRLSILGGSDGKNRARLLGGKTVPGDSLRKVTDKSVLAKIPKEAEGTLYFLDLKKFGMTDYGKISRRGWGYSNPAFEMEAFKNYTALIPARYPNGPKPLPIGKVLDNGTITHDLVGLKDMPADPNPRGGTFVCDDPRVSRWAEAPDAWIAGNMSAGWAYEHTPIKSVDAKAKTITLGAPSVYGVWSNTPEKGARGAARSNLSVRGFHVFNLIEELDCDGEYYIDRSNGIFYVMLKNPPTKKDAFSFSIFSSPILTFDGVSNVSISNVDISVCRDAGLRVRKADNFKLSGCILSGNKIAANIEGKNVSIDRCVIRNNAAGGISLRGGDETTLEKANSQITNSEFTQNGMRRLRGSIALTLTGVGLRLANCYFHDHPDHTVVYNATSVVIERNIFERCCQSTSDMGVIYGGGINGRHDRIIRQNFFTENLIEDEADTSFICGVYLDEGGTDVRVHDNIFCRTGTQSTTPAFGAIYIHGGFGLRANNNVFIDCESAFGCQTWSEGHYSNKLERVKNSRKYIWDRMTSEAYRKSYPDISKVLDPKDPRLNYAENNKVFGSSMAMNGDLYLRGNKTLFPNKGISKGMLFEKKDWTLSDVKKYFGNDPLVKRILSYPMGIQGKLP